MMTENEGAKSVEAPDMKKVMQLIDELSWTNLGFIRDVTRADCPPQRIKGNAEAVLYLMGELKPILEQTVKAYESF